MARRRKAMRNAKPSGSKYQKVLVDAQAMRQLQVYRYPFSVATSQPKIPDGSNTQTLGVKLQRQFSIKSDNIMFVLLPVYGVMLTIRSALFDRAPANGINFEDRLLNHDDAIPRFRIEANAFANRSEYSAYRIVSAGMRLKLISNDNENFGYWEAIRFNNSELQGNVFMSPVGYPLANNDAGEPLPEAQQNYSEAFPGGFRVHPNFLESLYAKTNWLNNPTYQMGKLKSLSQFEFRLSPQVEEHEFISIPKKMEVADNAFQNRLPNETDGFDLKHLFAWGFDPSFDCIAVYCTGFRTPGANQNDLPVNGSQILAHVVHNYEFKMDPDSFFNLYMTETTNAGTALKAKQLDFKVRDRLPGHYLAGPRS